MVNFALSEARMNTLFLLAIGFFFAPRLTLLVLFFAASYSATLKSVVGLLVAGFLVVVAIRCARDRGTLADAKSMLIFFLKGLIGQ